jgi:tetratricopeptide (TPR) repeat protein
MSLRLRAAGLLLLLGAGCGTQLVFVNPREGLARPYLETGSLACDAQHRGRQPNVDQLLDAGDRHRNRLLSASSAPPRFEPTRPIDSDAIVVRQIKAQQSQVTSYVQTAFATWKQAQVCYDAALQHDPSLSYALLNLAVISIRMYDFDPDPADREQFYTRAQNYLARAAEVNKYDAQAIYYVAELRVRKAQWEDAEARLNTLLQRGWNRAHVHNLLGYVYAMTNRPEKARAEWLAATQVDQPPEANAWAIQQTRPAKATGSETKPDVQPAKATLRWNEAAGKALPAPPPALPPRCVGLEDGRTQC